VALLPFCTAQHRTSYRDLVVTQRHFECNVCTGIYHSILLFMLCTHHAKTGKVVLECCASKEQKSVGYFTKLDGKASCLLGND
jgi:hypothetical protein